MTYFCTTHFRHNPLYQQIQFSLISLPREQRRWIHSHAQELVITERKMPFTELTCERCSNEPFLESFLGAPLALPAAQSWRKVPSLTCAHAPIIMGSASLTSINSEIYGLQGQEELLGQSTLTFLTTQSSNFCIKSVSCAEL